MNWLANKVSARSKTRPRTSLIFEKALKSDLQPVSVCAFGSGPVMIMILFLLRLIFRIHFSYQSLNDRQEFPIAISSPSFVVLAISLSFASHFTLRNPELITCILFDLGDTLIYLDKPTVDVVNSRLRALHETLLADGLEVNYSRLDETYRAVHSERSLFSQETGIETTTNRILEEVLARLGILHHQLRPIDDLVQSFFEPEIKSWKLYDDTVPILSSLRNQGFSLGLVSNARCHWAVVEIMKRLDIDRFFDTTITSAKFGLRKPLPEIYLKAMQDLRSHPGSTVMVGNSLDTDIIGAKRLKTRALHLEREILDQKPVEPDAAVRSLSDILGVIARWKES